MQELHQRQEAVLRSLSDLSRRVYTLRSNLKKHTGKDPFDNDRKRKRGGNGGQKKGKNQAFSYTKPNKQSCETVVDFLARKFTYHTAQRWAELVSGGAVDVNGVTATGETVLKQNDLVEYHRNQADEPEVDRTFDIVHEDANILVVTKSGNIPVSEGGRYFKNTLVHVLRDHMTTRSASSTVTDSAAEELSAAHRLDKETSGLVVLGKNEPTLRFLGTAFANDNVRKEYTAVLQGEFKDVVVCKAPLLPLFQSSQAPANYSKLFPEMYKIRMCIDNQKGKQSHTEFEPVFSINGLTLCRVRLYSGRTHQIRVHACHIGHPVLGDKLYGKTDEEFLALTRGEVEPEFPPWGVVKRHLLHCSEMEFPLPGGERKVTKSSFFPQLGCIPGLSALVSAVGRPPSP
eukprot:TRINITY_DN76508_c0_g1_i1.p1 TRINITY_DN76508_c0_g1~~TRINITY_DN76508_c0_g1_i1.p1  ORF type:complete len:401 (-),score=6.76 TRINITY_DN76508_c0_g1_i1:61-1263(-)